MTKIGAKKIPVHVGISCQACKAMRVPDTRNGDVSLVAKGVKRMRDHEPENAGSEWEVMP